MLLETAQILSTVWRECAAPEDVPAVAYARTHAQHPCVVWARSSTCNYFWLHDHGIAICDEYTMRFHGKRHASREVIEALRVPPLENVPTGPLLPFVQCMPEQYTGADAVEAYRRYYVAEKKRFASWRVRGAPEWFTLAVRRATMAAPQGTHNEEQQQ